VCRLIFSLTQRKWGENEPDVRALIFNVWLPLYKLKYYSISGFKASYSKIENFVLNSSREVTMVAFQAGCPIGCTGFLIFIGASPSSYRRQVATLRGSLFARSYRTCSAFAAPPLHIADAVVYSLAA
jgi:hypothetical protein